MVRNRLLVVFAVAALSAGLRGTAFASGEGTSAVPFLKVGPSPRAAAMADAFTAISNDASAISYNPAGMGLVDKKEVMFSHTSWFQGVRNEYLATAIPLSEMFTVGASVDYMFTDDMAERNIYGEQTGTFRETNGYISAGASYRPVAPFSMGLAVKGIRQTLAGEKGQAFAGSGGVLFTSRFVNVGAGFDNIGTKMTTGSDSFSLPSMWKGGVAVQPFERTFFSCDVVKARDRKAEMRLGAEAHISNLLGYSEAAMFFRAGFRTLKDSNTGPGLTGGIGLDVGTFSMDYAFVPYGDLGDTHRVAVTVRFGRNRLLTESRSWLLR